MTTDDLAAELTARLDDRLAAADAALASAFPGERPERQPIHTVYVPADRYHPGLVAAYGEGALRILEAHADRFAEVVQDDDVVTRVRSKLATEPVEDLRVDFEDGYVGRSEEQEDADVLRAATALATSQLRQEAAPFGGIRIKCFEAATRSRAVRTLVSYVTTLLERGGSVRGWVVTLPKVTSVDQVEAMGQVCGVLEQALGLPELALRFEVQVETPQSVLGPDGSASVARFVHAGSERLSGLHFGTYDYSAACGIVAGHQSLEHPAADHAKLVMQAAAAGTGVRLSDGSTNVLPVGGGDDVRAAWENHHRLVRRALERGFYQGWDLHPGQLPTRYAATYSFYREGLSAAGDRLAGYLRGAEGPVADEPATARALAAYLRRGVECGAVDEAEVLTLTGLSVESLTSLSRARHQEDPWPTRS